MKLLLSTLLLTASISDGFSQTRSIVGRIISSDDQKPIRDAHVAILGTAKNTVSNHLGYFALDIDDADSSSLIISHIAFTTSEVKIPETNKFMLQLKRDTIHIADFNMSAYESIDLDPIENTSEDPVSNYAEQHARYPGGWKYFINDLGNNLKQLDWKYLADEKSTITFAVDEVGKIADLNFDSLMSKNQNAIEDILISMPEWIPAKQRGTPVKQYFTFSIWSPETYSVIEDPARPEGGMTAFYKFVAEHLKYPPQARRMGIQGRVFVQFIIDPDGSITEVEVVKGLGHGLDEEAIRVISMAPKWKPGTQKGKPVRQRMVIPITFKIG